MIKKLSLSTLFMIIVIIIPIIGSDHWGWDLTQITCFILWFINFDKALKKEEELIKRIKELENIHKEK